MSCWPPCFENSSTLISTQTKDSVGTTNPENSDITTFAPVLNHDVGDTDVSRLELELANPDMLHPLFLQFKVSTAKYTFKTLV